MITINMDKAKEVAHNHRRIARELEFTPYDNIIAKQIPGTTAQEAEAQRQLIREKYAEMQDAMNAAQDPDALKALMPNIF